MAVLTAVNYEIVEFKILREVGKATNKLTLLDSRRPDLGLFRDLLGKQMGDILGGNGARRADLLRAQEQAIL